MTAGVTGREEAVGEGGVRRGISESFLCRLGAVGQTHTLLRANITRPKGHFVPSGSSSTSSSSSTCSTSSTTSSTSSTSSTCSTSSTSSTCSTSSTFLSLTLTRYLHPSPHSDPIKSLSLSV
ncbi:unnamed protein product [Pleuronectes platessa]|uniref:Uncharacterized protein n=1 Tax=Pleuronectes platessa TaxID=8262 RepID=A0A9N7YUL5_PLEPL|nr:unnamed protein product [Pleuronectes platessa]